MLDKLLEYKLNRILFQLVKLDLIHLIRFSLKLHQSHLSSIYQTHIHCDH